MDLYQIDLENPGLAFAWQPLNTNNFVLILQPDLSRNSSNIENFYGLLTFVIEGAVSPQLFMAKINIISLMMNRSGGLSLEYATNVQITFFDHCSHHQSLEQSISGAGQMASPLYSLLTPYSFSYVIIDEPEKMKWLGAFAVPLLNRSHYSIYITIHTRRSICDFRTSLII